MEFILALDRTEKYLIAVKGQLRSKDTKLFCFKILYVWICKFHKWIYKLYIIISSSRNWGIEICKNNIALSKLRWEVRTKSNGIELQVGNCRPVHGKYIPVVMYFMLLNSLFWRWLKALPIREKTYGTKQSKSGQGKNVS